MSTRTTEWRLRVSGNAESYLSRVSSLTDRLGGRFSQMQNAFNGNNFQNFAGEIPGASRGMELLSNSSMLAGVVIAALGAGLYKSTTLALDYEKGMAKINATAQLTAPELEKLKEQLKAIGGQSGGNFERIPDAFEKINSSLNDTKKSMEILKIANKSAQAGFVDIDVAAGALAQTISILGNKASATDIADVMFGAKKAGAAEFGDFAQYLPSLIAAGDNLNINYKDIAGMFSFMTTKFSAADSTMLLQNVMTAMGKGDIQKGFAQKGIKLFNKDGTMRDIGDFFNDLSGKMSGMSAEAKSKFLESIGLKDAQAKQGFSALLNDAGKLNVILKDVNKSYGELNKQFEVTENHSRTWGKIGDRLKNWGVTIGDNLLPVIDTLIAGVEGIGSAFGKLFNGDMFSKVMFQTNMTEEEYSKSVRANNEQKSKMELSQRAQFLALDKTDKFYKNKFGKDFSFDKLSDSEKAGYKAFYQSYEDALMGKKKDPLATLRPDAMGGLTSDKATSKSSKNKSIQSGINAINDGGKSVRNVTVTIQKMVDGGINISSQTIKEGAADMSRIIEDYILRAVNGAEQALANG